MRSRYLGKQPPSLEPALQAVPAPAPAGTLRVRSLGSFAVWRTGELLPAGHWGRRKVAALFKCLLSAPGYQLHREQVMDFLFPDMEPAEAAKGLRSTVYLLRKMLDRPGASASHLQSRGDLLALVPAVTDEPDADWLDAAAFAQAAAAALTRRDIGLCQAALNLYAGEYLPEDRYEEWAARRREELRGQHLALLLHLADLSVAHREVEEALRCLRTVLTVDPCHEDAARYLMELLAREGRRSEALEVYRALATALEEELGVSPARETRAVRARLLAEAPVALVPAAKRTNLPAPLTSFIGREWERAELTRFLREGVGGSRLLTLVGAGGCGKTRLALEVARALLDDYPDGVYLVELAPLADPGLLHQAVAGALGLRETQKAADQSVLDMLATYLSGRQLLLVLDNAEHVVVGAAELAVALLQAAPGLRILVTSQAALGVLGELAWRVPSLSLPEESDLPVADLSPYEAIQLFVERAQLSKPHFALTERNAAAVLQVCRRLDGIPLALELAAARLSVLSVEQLAGRLDDRLGLLTEGNRAALPRQQTLRATIEWSYNLLTAAERVLLGRLSVFAGGWTLEAAEGVCAGPKLSRRVALERLHGLVSKSLVQVEEREGAMRYQLLETVRAYAHERLEAAGELDALRERHAGWCQALAEEAALGLVGPDQGDWLMRLDLEHDNLRAALGWALERDEEGTSTGSPSHPERHEIAMRLATGIWRFWLIHGHVTEGRSWLDRLAQLELTTVEGERAALLRAMVLAATAVLATEQGEHSRAADLAGAALALYRELGDQRRSAATLDILATTAMRQGDNARAAALYEESLVIFRILDQQRSIATVLNNLGLAARYQGDYGRATALYEESLAIKQALGDVHGIAVALNNLGDVALDQGNVARARTLFERSLTSFQEQKGQWGIALLLTNLGNVARVEGEYEQAARLYRQSLILYRDMDNRVDAGECLEGLAAAICAAGEPHRAARLLGAAASVRAALNTPPSPRDRTHCERTREAVRAALGEEAFAMAWAGGAALSPEQAVTEALAQRP